MVTERTYLTGGAVEQRSVSVAHPQGAEVYVPPPTGGDDTRLWVAAMDSLPSGKGTVRATPGAIYKLSGLPLRENVYLDFRGASAEFPTATSGAMFVAAPAATFDGGGIIGGDFTGGDKSRHGVDFSAVTQLDSFLLDDAYLHHFNTAVLLTNNDRFPVIRHTRLWNNNVGLHGGEHPILDHVDFRANVTGLTGRLNDFQVANCKFTYNQWGVKPADGQSIQAGHFVGCWFFANSKAAAHVNNFAKFDGCDVVGATGAEVGIIADGSGIQINGGTFGLNAVNTGWTVGAVQYPHRAGGIVGGSIRGAEFYCYDGPAIVDVSATTVVRDIKVIGNGFRCASHPAVVMDTSPCHGWNVSGNTFRAWSGTFSGPLLVIDDAQGVGGSYLGNQFDTEPGVTVNGAATLDLRRSVHALNRYDGFGASPVTVAASDADTQDTLNVINA